MRNQYAVALTLLAGVAIGGAVVHGLHAQAGPPVYYVGEIDLTNPDAYTKEYLPGAKKIIMAHGGRYVAAGKGIAVEGEPPKARVVVIAFDNMQKIEEWRNAADYKELRKIGEKYGKFRGFAVEGSSQ